VDSLPNEEWGAQFDTTPFADIAFQLNDNRLIWRDTFSELEAVTPWLAATRFL
jgi:hypothetical protein